jgi:hypothetical protein
MNGDVLASLANRASIDGNGTLTIKTNAISGITPSLRLADEWTEGIYAYMQEWDTDTQNANFTTTYLPTLSSKRIRLIDNEKR